jgi:ubiquinone/menaquinone biosynthesis C-methylase UbiE
MGTLRRLAHQASRNIFCAILFSSIFLGPPPPRAVPVALQSTDATEAAPRKTSRPYTGDLSIFDSPDRAKKLQINRVMDILQIKSGSAVADIGAGSGWFTMHAAKRVGPSGVVYAEDINPQSIAYIQERAKKAHAANVQTILGQTADPLLPVSSVDSVLILKTYHEFAEPVLLLENLRKSLRPGARVGIIDRNGAGDDHGVNRDVVLKEAERAGYKVVEQYDFVKADREDYFLVLQPT